MISIPACKAAPFTALGLPSDIWQERKETKNLLDLFIRGAAACARRGWKKTESETVCQESMYNSASDFRFKPSVAESTALMAAFNPGGRFPEVTQLTLFKRRQMDKLGQ